MAMKKIGVDTFSLGAPNVKIFPKPQSDKINEIIDQVNDLIDGNISSETLTANTIAEYTASSGVTIDNTLIKDGGVTLAAAGILDLSADTVGTKIHASVTRYTKRVALTATEIVGTDAGDLGHAAGATLVAAPGAGFAVRVVDVIWNYTFDTAAYTGGGNDLVVQSGSTGTAWTAAVSSAALLGASADAAYSSPGIAASLDENESIVAASTAWTNPGTAAGTLDIIITYDVVTV